MTENTHKNDALGKPKKATKLTMGFSFFTDPRFRLAVGCCLLILSIYFFIAFISYLFTGKIDQSVVDDLFTTNFLEAGRETANWLGLYGAYVSHVMIFKWMGVLAYTIPPLLFLLGFQLVFKRSIVPLFFTSFFLLFSGLWLSIFFGYVAHTIVGIHEVFFLTGGLGYYLALFFDSLFGWGTLLFLALTLLIFIIYYFNVTSIGKRKKTQSVENQKTETSPIISATDLDHDNSLSTQIESTSSIPLLNSTKSENVESTTDLEKSPAFTIEKNEAEPTVNIKQQTKEKDLYDPTQKLSHYQMPPLHFLHEYNTSKIQVTQQELNQNKERIIETLTNFKIGITSIKATIGPTVTLYEIIPEAGIKISRIKNLEDDIALNLSALGIRIIAPIPGKGTIGIEVPNKNREMVSIRSVLATEKFQKSDRELPIAIGKTISNEVMVIDLAKLPHLLVAGATGQGKSVGLNVILTSLLYKRHPSQLKFVLVDPKKVELSLFRKIEHHYLAKLPNAEEAIITDTRKVVHTLNSLCIEMEDRYEMMKKAGSRNLKEYHVKFIERKLDPREGHRFFPYIVLVIDELADLMMTSGKEIETPIARLAQLARAIGIHLVVATQRPSVNVITGIIKANFPARLSFRVTSKIDSRTILDTGGAEQLIGQGDMLLSVGSDIVRIQSPFVDTPEIEKICDFISDQMGYQSAYLLPEYEDEDSSSAAVDLTERDDRFEEAARLIVIHQQGSTSLLQRKLKLGYNRAGRLMDQLEAAGIVGPFEGSKARDVLVYDEMSLERLLDELEKKL